jgi:acetoin utilization deacetylase AcuC-like enzyme
MNTVAVIRDPLYLAHSCGPGHLEAPERLLAINTMLEGFPLREHLRDIPARDARRDELTGIHEEAYVDRIERTRERPFTMLDSDTATNDRSYAAPTPCGIGGRTGS